MVQSDLKWNLHLEKKVTKVNQMVAMIQRNVCSLKDHQKISIQHLCWSHLEYASTVCSPWESYLEDALEKFGIEQHDMFVINMV